MFDATLTADLAVHHPVARQYAAAHGKQNGASDAHLQILAQGERCTRVVHGKVCGGALFAPVKRLAKLRSVKSALQSQRCIAISTRVHTVCSERSGARLCLHCAVSSARSITNIACIWWRRSTPCSKPPAATKWCRRQRTSTTALSCASRMAWTHRSALRWRRWRWTPCPHSKCTCGSRHSNVGASIRHHSPALMLAALCVSSTSSQQPTLCCLLL